MDRTKYLEYLERYNMSEAEKIKLIDNLYRLANINFNNFVENN